MVEIGALRKRRYTSVGGSMIDATRLAGQRDQSDVEDGVLSHVRRSFYSPDAHLAKTIPERESGRLQCERAANQSLPRRFV